MPEDIYKTHLEHARKNSQLAGFNLHGACMACKKGTSKTQDKLQFTNDKTDLSCTTVAFDRIFSLCWFTCLTQFLILYIS